MTRELVAPDEAATRRIGAALARALEPGAVIHLHGELGAGKTTLARALITTLAPGARVKSPTYTLIESYPDATPPIHHLDLYRIADPGELEFLGLRELADEGAAMLVEWPQRGADRIPAPDVTIALALDAAGTGRHIVLAPRTERGRRIAARFQAAQPT